MLETFVCVSVGTIYLLVSIFTSDEQSSKEKEQLDKLNDGMGNIIADDEFMSREEAEDAQSRGELYDTYY
ncbi:MULTISPECIES: hypothetical protein [Pseudoalteromonas]|uniref:hypothetical protein n=1 Tax=Pseudoalteromonas TaxID=53246 RepID=UPI0007837863|nr:MULTISPECIES: hypothetical protein [Pseudoalteromonas]MCP4588204.1 hypothetical protein [Pseudoalteromonas sp.]